MRKNNYYDNDYFTWQKKAGEYGAKQDIWMYKNFIKNSDTVLDFGCGGGYILERLPGNQKYGIDINPVAREIAQQKGITVFEKLDNLPSQKKFDVIISHHTLEHVQNPARILKQLKIYLKKNGTLICVVPIDDWRNQKKYTTKDINHHLYTWTPLLLGNLFVQCGYTIQSIKIITRAWVPYSRFYYQYVPKPLYSTLSTLWSVMIRSRQIRIIATL